MTEWLVYYAFFAGAGIIVMLVVIGVSEVYKMWKRGKK